MQYFFAGMLLLDAAVHLFACVNKNLLMVRRVSKCLLMPLLAACYLLFAREPSAYVIAAILFGFAGDLILLFRPRHWAFPAGIFAFAVGHVFYIVSFIRRFSVTPQWYVLALMGAVVIACAATLMRYLWKGMPGKLCPPSFIYMLIISTMVCCSILFSFYSVSAHRWLAAVGGLLFAFSDTTLSIDAFHHPIRHRSILVMSTYIAAQVLIVSALAFT
ncbi:MAG: lysoplasmalogenase [Eubacteriales bacterium]|nr:lysoplasmalogenase [Eubacteriales bacterium]